MASALLLASGTTGLAALQSVSIAMGGFHWFTILTISVYQYMVYILLRSFLFSDDLLKGVLYNVLISVACVALQQGLESTLNGKSVNQEMEFRSKWSPWHNCATHTGVSNTPSKPLASFTTHLLDPFATDPYSELCFAKMRCQALIFLKVAFFLFNLYPEAYG